MSNEALPFDIGDTIEKSIKKIYQSKGDISFTEEGFAYDNKTLNDAIDKGVELLNDNVINQELVSELKRNIGVFCAFKNHHETQAIVSLLTDDEGNIVPFSDFKKEALKISNKYKKTWLQTEYRTAQRRANFAVKFDEYVNEAHLYPNLEWTPSRSGSPREDHKEYYGTIRPVNDPFWNTQFPGMEWNCKCGVKQTKAPVTDPPEELKQAPNGLDENPALAMSIFSKSHPYFKGLSEKEVKELRKKLNDVIPTIPYPKTPQYKSIGKVFVHPFAEPNIKEFNTNFETAKIIADNIDIIIKLRYHVDSLGIKNPEYDINDIIGDLTNRNLIKDTKPQNFIKNSTRKLHQKEQLGNLDKTFIVMNFGDIKTISNRNINKSGAALQEAFKKFNHLEFVILIANNKVWKIDRLNALKLSSKEIKINLSNFFSP